MKIVLDVFGGDNSPAEILKGAQEALAESTGFSLVLVGDKKVIQQFVEENGLDVSRVEIVDAEEIITNDDVPTEAIRNKRNSSIVKGLEYLNDNEDAKGFVSAGSTGAVLTGAVLLLRRIRGINRPGLCPVLPTVTDKNVVLIDCGANVEPKALNLLQFAKMGSAYMKSVQGIDNPAVGLLSNGTEDKKGNSLTKEAFPMLEESELNFIGNIEARDILSGAVDVVVSDGFSGNVALKSCEGTAVAMFKIIKDAILAGGLRAKLGYLLLKPVFKGVKHRLDYNDNGGAILLGLEKIVVKSHGSSKAKSIKNSILQAKNLIEKDVVGKIKEELGA
ncbi:MAG: phosphate acyltransferase PlsX [Clostridia bacterium]|nr:phosphate acyltransferase PlsX [Clostridia bacterium]